MPSWHWEDTTRTALTGHRPFENRLNFAGCQGIVHNLATGPVDDLSINIYGRPDGGGLKVNMDANPAVYHADELEDHGNRFLTLLKTIAVLTLFRSCRKLMAM